ncbi:hypothetical protein Pla22_51540 [Rubripirellula amarantea]|uniref:Transmembrane protein n=1 Tax=Rubripirellula amarantea TaxID=2527999 RepID=A0A5C5WDE0_9BACT|nr:hypothetical protein [Rubripirellula amarantea]TWT48153.1 hypothetical protein Pla22_51540 [Rubripirellula amarantea]
MPLLFSIEPFTFVLALLPLVGYLFVLGLIRFSRRALVTTGSRDVAALAVAVCGFVAAGPAELLFPTTAATVFGPMVWLALIAFYSLSVSLIALTVTPKLVVYGRTPEETFDALLRACLKIDAGSTGDANRLQVFLPSLDVRLRIDGIRGLDYCRVLTFEPVQSVKFWSAMLANLRGELQTGQDAIPRRGLAMLVTSFAIAGILAWYGLNNQTLVVDGFRDWLWR